MSDAYIYPSQQVTLGVMTLHYIPMVESLRAELVQIRNERSNICMKALSENRSPTAEEVTRVRELNKELGNKEPELLVILESLYTALCDDMESAKQQG
ncbi:hypothetical protein IYR97_23345 (plasmid) [Pseudomonas fulva]|jgi:hypothetical protein|uniref:Chorismate mutase n=3 Tax=Pseudomonas TaxID=286 RepID=A0A1X0ZMS4_PSEPU|nr:MULTISPECIES: hypothetical protein [Pseudomonas]MCT8164000.1 hypothetical protein [Pseudomonas sp. HD6422]MCT8183012.1 hypothetical protein [Pseudomonas sp. HD6421]MDH1930496.1 hypothetical protein [Pseudomonas sp. GD03696]MDM1711717.1 hypothetical protein [Pseudomonas sp. 165]ORL48625.1 hypothetical protein B7H18_26050 [Pseudomonas putida]